MIGKTMEKALNEQINAELYSFYLYLSMSSWCEAGNWSGMAAWMRKQAEEEMTHAMKLFRYVTERGGRVQLPAIAEPPAEWASPLALFEASLAHEREVTARISALVERADAEKDHATHAFLQWFVTEQVEEESTLEPVVAHLKLAGDNVAALLGMDRSLGARQ